MKRHRGWVKKMKRTHFVVLLVLLQLSHAGRATSQGFQPAIGGH